MVRCKGGKGGAAKAAAKAVVTKASAKATAKAALLERLGITQDEANLLLS
jgi:hypothetical protein